MPFFPEIDVKKSRENACKILEGYKRWCRVAGEPMVQRVTASYTLTPKGPSGNTSQVERLAIRKADADAEVAAIERAVSGLLEPYQRRILYEKHMVSPRRKDWEIYNELGMSETTFYEIYNQALLAFAELYRNGEQLQETE